MNSRNGADQRAQLLSTVGTGATLNRRLVKEWKNTMLWHCGFPVEEWKNTRLWHCGFTFENRSDLLEGGPHSPNYSIDSLLHLLPLSPQVQLKSIGWVPSHMDDDIYGPASTPASTFG